MLFLGSYILWSSNYVKNKKKPTNYTYITHILKVHWFLSREIMFLKIFDGNGNKFWILEQARRDLLLIFFRIRYSVILICLTLHHHHPAPFFFFFPKGNLRKGMRLNSLSIFGWAFAEITNNDCIITWLSAYFQRSRHFFYSVVLCTATVEMQQFSSLITPLSSFTSSHKYQKKAIIPWC